MVAAHGLSTRTGAFRQLSTFLVMETCELWPRHAVATSTAKLQKLPTSAPASRKALPNPEDLLTNPMTHPIVLPPHIEIKLIDEAPRFRDGGAARERWLIQRAAQLGADQELEASRKAITAQIITIDNIGLSGPAGVLHTEEYSSWPAFAQMVSRQLRAARRPRPPSLKQQALEALDSASYQPGSDFKQIDPARSATIRRALESLPDPQD